MLKIGNLFHLASKQLYNECKDTDLNIYVYKGDLKYLNSLISFYGLRCNPIKTGNTHCIVLPFSINKIIDYTLIIRKTLDRYGKKGKIYKVKNIRTGKVVNLISNKERRHIKYLETGT